jgi:hypothetical protein
MQSVTLYRYWQFGTGYRYLQDAKSGYSIHGPGLIVENIKSLFEKLEELDLRVTIRAAYDLRAQLKEFETLPQDSKLTASQASTLNTIVKALRQTLQAELMGANAYVISPKRIDTEKLIGDVSSLLSPGVFDSLSESAKLDLMEAGKCIAFERSTAAAFHLMRATEEALRVYYCHFIRKDRLSPMLWGPMVQSLQKHRKAKVNDTLHKNLDNIRLSFRNPTQHPDKVYDIHEVQDLWALSVDVISRIDRAIKAYK